MRKALNDNKFLCPKCLMQAMAGNQSSSDWFAVELNPVEEIAFSMSEAMYKQIHDVISELDGELAKTVNANKDLVKCITWKDIDDYLRNRFEKGKTVRGTLVLGMPWLARKMGTLVAPETMVSAATDPVLYEGQCDFRYVPVNGVKIPKAIFDGDGSPISDERRCARCGRLLPPDTGMAPELRILLQGSSRAGKTSCIISTIKWLLKTDFNLRKGIRIKLVGMQDELDEKRYHNWIHRELGYYNAGEIVEKTPDEQKIPNVLSVPVWIDKRKFVLSFVDMPGEFFDKVDKKQDGKTQKDPLINQYSQIYRYSDAIWTFLQYETLDPRERTQEEYEETERDTGTTKEQLQRTEYSKYTQRLNDIRQYFKDMDISLPPHAVVLTKTDSIKREKEHLASSFVFDAKGGREDQILVSCPEKNGNGTFFALDELQFQNVSSRIYSFCRDIKEGLCEVLNGFSDQSCYFAMSAYGHPAAKRQSGDGTPPRPYHAQLPLLWTMAICDHLPIRYSVKDLKRLNLIMQVVTGRNSEVLGNHEQICMFSKADQTCRINLMGHESDYKFHERFV